MNNYYEIEIKGKSLRLFINRILKSNINIYDIKYEKEKIIIKCSYQDYQKIKKLNYTNKIKIIKVHGNKKLKDLIKKYHIFLLGFIISVITLYIISNIIFIIEIDTEKEELKEIIKAELTKENIKKYRFKSSSKKLNLTEEKIKNNQKDKIEWIEIKQEGIYLKVSIVERIKKEENKKEQINDIVATQDGYIMDIYSTSGELLKVKGDYVKKGETIISGNIHRNENVVAQISAKGDVYAKVWYKLKLNRSIYYQNKIKQEKGYKKIIINILGKDIVIFKYQKKVNKEKLNEIIKTPFITIKLNEEKDVIIKKDKYKQNDLKNILKQKAREELTETLKEKEYIISQKTLKSYIENDKMYVEVFFEVYKNIAKSKEIPILEIKKDD